MPSAAMPSAASSAAPTTAPAPTATPADDDEVPVPQWQSLLKAMAPPPTEVPEAEQTDPRGLFLPDAGPVVTEDDDLGLPERVRRPLPFTWLQWIILAVVAFALGFLIIFVARTATGSLGPEVPAQAAVASLAAPAP